MIQNLLILNQGVWIPFLLSSPQNVCFQMELVKERRTALWWDFYRIWKGKAKENFSF